MNMYTKDKVKVKERVAHRVLCGALALAISGFTLGTFTPAIANPLYDNPWTDLRTRTQRTLRKYQGRTVESFVNSPVGETYIRWGVPVERTIRKCGTRAYRELEDA